MTPRVVQLPVIFFAEDKAMRTGACLQVSERLYPDGRWMEGGGEYVADNAGRAFAAVMAAIARKDRAELLRLADPARGRDPTQFEQQANALFRQFQTMRVVGVPRAYEFDGLVVFFARIQAGTRTFHAPFVFSVMINGALGFLPYRTEQLTYVLVKDWFDSEWGPANAANPSYCSAEQVRRATHKVALAGSGGARNTKDVSYLLLNGAPLGAGNARGSAPDLARMTLESMRTAAARQDVEGVARQMTAIGGGRLRQWYATAEALDRERYMTALAGLKPLFAFDASPLVIAYAISPTDGVQALYLTSGAGKTLLWTNSSHLTVADQVFKDGPLIAAAAQEKAFATLVAR